MNVQVIRKVLSTSRSVRHAFSLVGRRSTGAKWRLVIPAIAILAIACIVARGDNTPTAPLVSERPPVFTSASFIVKLAGALSADEQQAVIARNGGVEISSVPALRLHHIEAASDTLNATVERYQSDPQVESVEREKIRAVGGTPSDPAYPDQWALPKIGWDSVYGTVSPTGTATIAVLDTGVDASQPDLVGHVSPGYSVLSASSADIDPNGHGTWLASIAAASTDNNLGIAGAAYSGANIMPVQVLDSTGAGQDGDIISGVVWAADHNASVILMGFSNPGFSQNLQDAIDYAWSKGAVLVAASGNDGSASPTYPAGDAKVIGVSATDSSDSLWSGSNYGADTFIAAPGVGITADAPGDATTSITGTSASAAFVAGAAALLVANDPTASNAVVVGRLARNADSAATQEQTGNGRLNLARSIADTATDPIVPTGAPGGGPLVGPYTSAAAQFSINDVSLQEGNSGSTSFVFTVTLSGAGGSGTFTINYATVNATATGASGACPNANDFQTKSGSLTFPSGNGTQTVTVPVCGDTTDEANETFTVHLSSASSGTITKADGTGTIGNDDGPAISINDVSVVEGNSGTSNAVFTVSLSFASTHSVSVNYATANGTATAGSDYTALTTTTLAFAAGETSKTITVQVTGDTAVEPDETFVVNLSGAVSGSIADGQGVGTILNDDDSMSISDATVTEGNSGTSSADFTVSLAQPSVLTVNVNYATADGTATQPGDYTAIPATMVTFAPGETSKIITVLVNGDTLDEANETFFVNLTSPTNSTISDGQGLGTITDDDPAPTVTLSLSGSPFAEAGGTATVTATLSAVSGQTATVNLAFSGTATLTTDYTRSGTSIIVPAGSTSGSMTLTAAQDTLDENDETIIVDISSVTNGTESGTQQVAATITDDDDPPTVSFSLASSSGLENVTPA